MVDLRLISEDDFETILSWENNIAYWVVSGTRVPFSKDLIKAYVSESQDVYKVKQVRFVIYLKHEPEVLVGCVDLFEFDPFNLRAGVGILIDDNERGKGYGKEALKLIEKYAATHLKVKNLYCNILANNKASNSLFKAVGYKKCGEKLNWTLEDGEWIDEHFYQKEIVK